MKRILSAILIMIALHIAAASEPGAAESQSAHVDGLKIHYTNYGEGPFAVVFVHGWTCDENVWEGQGPALVAQNIRAITIDLPGHGQSDKPQIDYTPDLSARAIAAVLDHAGVKTGVLVGHSLGTAAIRQAYRQFPGRVAALVVVDGALRPFGDAAMLEQFIAPLRGAEYEQAIARSIDAMTQQISDLAARARIKASMGRSPQHVTVSAMEATRDPTLWKPDMIDVPVLMIMARNPRWNADYEQFVQSFIPNLDYQVWENVSHFLMMEKPREFSEALVAFMRKHLLLPERS
jgi:pimeloyl-ACP methyl ester carboxylesterase